MSAIRILFLSDTHLGFDMPFRPRIERRRRGPDFLANFERALDPARRGKVDCVLHGGDLLYRSRVPAKLVAMALEPLKQLADQGIPVYLVPGNHERSQIPYGLLAQHPNLHLFDRPRTFLVQKNGFTLALSGFPHVRGNIRRQFRKVLDQTGWRDTRGDAKLLCIHHPIEGARVSHYTFRNGQDVIRASDVPQGLTAVLSGHIHRAQLLTKNLEGKPLAAPVLYPGSIERTSFAEKDEKKGYLTLALRKTAKGMSRRFRFHELPARPMVQIDLEAAQVNGHDFPSWLRNRLEKLPPDAVVKLKLSGQVPMDGLPTLSAASLRSLAPRTMNVSVTLPAPGRG